MSKHNGEGTYSYKVHLDGLQNGALNDLAFSRRATELFSENSESSLDVWVHVLRSLPPAPVNENDVVEWVEGPLRGFFPFEKFYAGYGSLSGGRIKTRSVIASGHTPEFLGSLQSTFDLKSRGCLAWWVSNRRAFLLDRAGALDEEGRPILATKLEFEEIERFSLGIVAAHGVVDPFANAGTYISFAGVPGTHPKRIFASLNLIAPVLHTLFLQTKRAEESRVDLMALTDRQRELVDLALMGLPDKIIASHLAISDHTVGNHFRAIYAKLGVSKRSQLVALLK